MAKVSGMSAALLAAMGTAVAGSAYPADMAKAAATRRETPESRAQSYISEARSKIIEIGKGLQDKKITCYSEMAFEGSINIASVDGLMQGLVTNESRFPPYMQAGLARAISMLGMEAGKLRLELADTFLSANCVSQADQLYRFVLSNFSNPTFAGLRQRAQVGIDDVREKKAKQESERDQASNGAQITKQHHR